jgi:hypothetical protein
VLHPRLIRVQKKKNLTQAGDLIIAFIGIEEKHLEVNQTEFFLEFGLFRIPLVENPLHKLPTKEASRKWPVDLVTKR